MTIDLDCCVTRYIIRKTRHNLGLRQEDVTDKSLSHGTISNIERGTNYVEEDKVNRYLIKIGLNQTRLNELVIKEQLTNLSTL